MSILRLLARRFAPRTDGAARLDCLAAPVDVIRDRHAFVHVYARSLDDALRAQGYVHAQDRLFQMELVRRLGRGRLAELAGPKLLDLDRFVRRLRIGWAADREAASLDPETSEKVAAYCDGVNAFLARGPRPLELRLARLRPEPWTAADVVLVGKVLAVSLSCNWETELARHRLAARLGVERMRRLDPAAVPHGPAIVSDRLARGAFSAAARLGDAFGRGGSNGWAVAGSRTATGRPLLANDPHLALALPAVWHVQHLEWDEGRVSGFTIAGAPGVVLGRTDGVAWGFTAAFVDVQDLFLERFEPGTRRYLAGSEWLEAEHVREVIRVRGRREPVVEDVLVTRHGPLVAGPDPETGEALALRWSAHEPGTTGRAFLELARAQSVEEAERAFFLFQGPPQNAVLADAGGTIAFRTIGGPVPVRSAGNGSLPAPGWDSSHEWTGWVPAEELPSARDPERGFLVTANNRIVDSGYPHELGADVMAGYRAARIEELLAARAEITVEDCRRIQLDQISLPGLELAAIAREISVDGPAARRALELLAAWDGDLGPASAAGELYCVLVRRLAEEAYAEAGTERDALLGAGRSEATAAWGFQGRVTPAVLGLLAGRDDAFFSDGRTWEEVFRTALAAALAELGSDPARWRWGRRHRLLLAHPLGELPFLGRLFDRGPFELGGDGDTVFQASWPAARPYGPRLVGPSMRAVYDLADPDGTWVALPGGQSGHPGSPHYDDLLPRWLGGELVQLPVTRPAVQAAASARLTLTPAGNGP
jgi:penicillin amidase